MKRLLMEKILLMSEYSFKELDICFPLTNFECHFLTLINDRLSFPSFV